MFLGDRSLGGPPSTVPLVLGSTLLNRIVIVNDAGGGLGELGGHCTLKLPLLKPKHSSLIPCENKIVILSSARAKW